MNPWPALLLALVIAMTPEMREAFSQITGMQIMAGTVDLRPAEQLINCRGLNGGQVYEIDCRWVGGVPAWIKYRLVGVSL